MLAYALEIAHFPHDQLYAFKHVFARLGHAFEAFAMARKNFHTQLLLQLNDRFGHARLGRVQRTRGFGEVQVAPHGFLDKAELVEVHA